MKARCEDEEEAPCESQRKAQLSLRSKRAVMVAVGLLVILCLLMLLYGFLVPRSAFYASSLSFQEVDASEFDVVVVGAGPAGSVIASSVAAAFEARLPGHAARVLLLESGPGSQRVLGGKDWLFRDRTIFDVPLAWSYVSQLPRYLWDVPLGLLARALGGCGVHNAMLYVRALKEDVEAWNATSWSWDELLAKYLQIEDWQGDAEVEQGWAQTAIGDLGSVPEYHAAGGMIATSGGGYSDLLARKFLETVTHPVHVAEGIGMARSHDFNVPGHRSGAGYYNFNIRDGQRESAAAAFLGGTIEGYAPLSRLDIRQLSTVIKLGLSDDKRRVTYVDVADEPRLFLRPTEVLDDETAKRIVVNRLRLAQDAVVVLTMGAVLTPHLLHVSGIGPAVNLKAAGIEPLVDAPMVGAGLQDHPAVGIVFDVAPALTADMAGLYGRFINWTHGQAFGTYSRAFGYPGFSAGAFFDSGLQPPGMPPDLQLTVFPIQIEPHLTETSKARVRYDQAVVTVALVRPDTTFQVTPDPHDGGPKFSVTGSPISSDDSSQQAKPPGTAKRSTGGIAPLDAQRLAAGVRRVRQIFDRPPLEDYVVRETAPGPTVISDTDLTAWVQASYTHNSHWCCSVNFSPIDGALDPTTLSLRQIPNIRVADSSAYPKIPNGNVHSTVVAVAGVFADRLSDERVEHHLNLSPRHDP